MYHNFTENKNMKPTEKDFTDPFYVEPELTFLDNILTLKFRNHAEKS